MWIAAGLTVETAVFALAGFAWFRSRGYTLAESAAAGIIAMFMTLSTVQQLACYMGLPWFGLILESSLLVILLLFCRRWIPRALAGFSALKGFLRGEVLPASLIAVAWLAMGLSVVRAWVSTVPLSAAVFGQAAISVSSSPSIFVLARFEAIPPLNAPALWNHTARFGLAAGASGFGLWSSMAIGFSTYALARRYAWPPMALTVALLVLSMPRLVLLGGVPEQELIFSSTVCFCVVLVYRLVEQHQRTDLWLFLLCICFSLTVDPASIALSAILTLLMIVVVVRRHGWLVGKELLANPFPDLLLVVPAFLVLAQLPGFVLNLVNGHPLFGGAAAAANHDLPGSFANLVNYLVASIDPTEPVRRTLDWLIGLDLNRLLTAVPRLLTLPLQAGQGDLGRPALLVSGATANGFGPFASLLILPAMVHAAVRGTRRLKATVVAWAGYLYIASLVVAWQPGSVAHLTPLYAANGFIVAFSLPPWRLRRRGMRIFQIVLGVLMLWSLGRLA